MVKENIVADVGAGIAIEGKGAAERVAVDNNELFDVAAHGKAPLAPFGILLRAPTSVGVVGNTRRPRRPGRRAPGFRAGILVLAVDDVHVSGNVVDGDRPPRRLPRARRAASP